MAKRVLLFVAAILVTIGAASQTGKTRVACVGNSITFGAFIPERETNHYPAQLQRYLGEGYEVRNFGVNGATALREGDYPYMNNDLYKESLAFQPDIVLIKLGTNDTKPWNWAHKDRFMEDYQVLIDSYKSLPSNPRIILVTPIRCYIPDDDPGINSLRIEREVRPMVEEMAYRNSLDIINMFNVVGDRWDAGLMPDKLHPSAKGAGMMALKIRDHLTVTEEEPGTGTPFYKENATPFNFHGYQGYDFVCEGVPCKVVEPKITAKGKPWIWRARFWGHEPQTDIDLLEHGYHVAYCDVGNLYGAPQAVKRWDMFYKKMRKAGFSAKMALEGMSRGGLIIYNWAAKNPRKVACIYADAPVMDIKSWPMSSPGARNETKTMLKAYGFSDEAQASRWKGNPLDHAKVMAKAGIPILHVVGDADEVVPYDANTKVFEAEMKRLGAPIKVIHKPSVGHHPHSLSAPKPIVDFILQAMNQ